MAYENTANGQTQSLEISEIWEEKDTDDDEELSPCCRCRARENRARRICPKWQRSVCYDEQLAKNSFRFVIIGYRVGERGTKGASVRLNVSM